MGMRRHDDGLITRAVVGAIGAGAVLFGLWAFSGQPDLLQMFTP